MTNTRLFPSHQLTRSVEFSWFIIFHMIEGKCQTRLGGYNRFTYCNASCDVTACDIVLGTSTKTLRQPQPNPYNDRPGMMHDFGEPQHLHDKDCL